uniref:Macaca fascicularis brain cDNA clone: QflA-17295, similar to human protein phosphatase 1, catalytic subunit, beta isoform(PPP1CB), transcript variant 2, mRNA, RefSeq: NM_206877.1 n=1 Tax=Macaca fascicularis TaxID=9541 RepID=I7G4A0_MACFA|nr:unnamed protein product [Macaca fascicularis]
MVRLNLLLLPNQIHLLFSL